MRPRVSEPRDRPAWVDAIDNPYLRGIYAPTDRETTADTLEVEGEIPRDLWGSYVRNGPNPVHEPPGLYHWFDGDGMLHAVHFENGRASYRSRFVRTDGLAREASAGRAIWPGILGPFDFDLPGGTLKDTANTDVVFHDGHLLALWYLCGTPYRLDPRTLEPRGRTDFGGRLRHAVSAHPKVDPRTGDLCWFTVGDEPPYMHTGVVSPGGVLVHEIPIELPGPRSPHDLTITEHHTILHDFPYFADPDLARQTKRRVARFHPDVPSRFAVVPRFGAPDDVRWFEFEPGYVLHMVNAWEDGDWIIMDGCRQPDPTIRRNPEEGRLGSMLAYFRQRFHLHRWRMNLATGETREEALDDANLEFPKADVSRLGRRTRYSYSQEIPPDGTTLEFHALVRFDHETLRSERYDYGAGNVASEAPFAPRSGSDGSREDDGWVVTIVTNSEHLTSECWVLDASDVTRGPIARVKLPTRVPAGFHATWVPGESLPVD